VAEDQEVQEQELRDIFQEKTKFFTKSRGAESFWTVGSIGHVAKIHGFRGKNPSRKSEERIPEELGSILH
jgi:hypothetical protein